MTPPQKKLNSCHFFLTPPNRSPNGTWPVQCPECSSQCSPPHSTHRHRRPRQSTAAPRPMLQPQPDMNTCCKHRPQCVRCSCVSPIRSDSVHFSKGDESQQSRESNSSHVRLTYHFSPADLSSSPAHLVLAPRALPFLLGPSPMMSGGACMLWMLWMPTRTAALLPASLASCRPGSRKCILMGRFQPGREPRVSEGAAPAFQVLEPLWVASHDEGDRVVPDTKETVTRRRWANLRGDHQHGACVCGWGVGVE